jgi:carboxylesterase type B
MKFHTKFSMITQFLKLPCLSIVGLIIYLSPEMVMATQTTPESCSTAVVMTSSGPVCGELVTTSTGKKSQAFLGIPFAESTAQENRWAPPVPKASWSETRSAKDFGAICPQSGNPQLPLLQSKSGLGNGTDQSNTSSTVTVAEKSEDCLNLNVWAPAAAQQGPKRAVMVFLYGGAFDQGKSSNPLYDGAYLAANQDILLVSFNYRLGVLGFLAADGLTGNYGFLDQQLALAWVQKNIASFGGDPDKVTLVGESAGAMLVSLHLFSARDSQPLFRAAVMQSPFFSLPYKGLQEQVDVGNLFKRQLGCADTRCLRNIDAAALVAAQRTFTNSMSAIFSGPKYYLPFTPLIDGVVLNQQPVGALGQASKPFILGTNKDEGSLFVSDKPISTDAYTLSVANLFGRDFQKVLNQYPVKTPDENIKTWAQVQTDGLLRCSSRSVATNADAPVFIYAFNHTPSFKVWGGPECNRDGTVCHGAELPFVFHSAEQLGAKFSTQEQALSHTVIDYWVSFVKHLDPSADLSKAPNRTVWPRFTEQAKNYLVFGQSKVSVQSDPFREICDFWDDVGYNKTDPWPFVPLK